MKNKFFFTLLLVCTLLFNLNSQAVMAKAAHQNGSDTPDAAALNYHTYLPLVRGSATPAADTEAESLIRDNDLDEARILTNLQTQTRRSTGLSTETKAISSRLTESSVTFAQPQLRRLPQVSLKKASHIVYVQQRSKEGKTEYQIRVRSVQDRGDFRYRTEQVIFRGYRTIESVAVSLDGEFLIFSAKNSKGNFEIYIFDEDGNYTGEEGVHRLTNTPYDESHVSMSLDGATLAWQSWDETAGLSNFIVATMEPVTLQVSLLSFVFDVPVQAPSLSGVGQFVVFIADFSALNQPNRIGVIQSDGTANPTLVYQGNVQTPSLTAYGERLLFAETFEGVHYVSLLDFQVRKQVDLLTGTAAEHPYIAADGDFFAYTLDGAVHARAVDTDDPVAAHDDVVQSAEERTNSAAYWAKLGLISYESDNLAPQTFIRPDNNSGLTDAQRTVHYHTFSFKAPVTDFYQIRSNQDYDGYLHLYKKKFSPDEPLKNLLVENDDNGPYSSNNDPAGRSAIFFTLEKNERYVVVTSACGDPNAGCGPDQGTFLNTIVRGATPPPPPTELPTPDDSRYNITLRFLDNNLTPEQAAVFTGAAERWSSIIRGDLQDLPNFNLPPNFSVANTPGAVGTLDDVLIDVSITNIDGPNGILGQAGPRLIRTGTANDPLTVYGFMQFDISEFAPGGFFEDPQSFQDTIVHEMGHVLGIGTLWQLTGNTQGILANPPTVPPGLPNPNYDPRFTGAGATLAYQHLLTTVGKPVENSVPIDNTGGPGNYNSHWRELTFENELMTPYAGGAELLSRITAASLGDLGYTVNISSTAVDQSYTLSLEPTFRQIAPTPTTYVNEVDYLKFSGSVGAITATVQAVDLALVDPTTSTSGCEAADFTGFTAGKIALLQRGTCTFAQKVENAAAAGAVGVVMFNQGDNPNNPARTGLFRGNVGQAAIPAVGIPFALGQTFAAMNGLVVSIDTPVPVTAASAQAWSRAGIAPAFEEEILRPIGVVGPNGDIKIFGN